MSHTSNAHIAARAPTTLLILVLLGSFAVQTAFAAPPNLTGQSPGSLRAITVSPIIEAESDRDPR